MGTGKFTKLVTSMIKLPNYNKSIIIGLLLSDGWLTFASKTNKNARLGFKQTINKASYVWFIFNELSHYCSSYPYYAESKRSGKVLYNLGFFTRGLTCFTELYPLFYINNVKIVPEDIYNLLTPVALLRGGGNRTRRSEPLGGKAPTPHGWVPLGPPGDMTPQSAGLSAKKISEAALVSPVTMLVAGL